MAKQFQWRRHFDLISGGYPGEDVGVIPNDQSWHTTDATSGSLTADYYYRDSAYGRDSDSTRVIVTLRDDWTASINSRNQLTVTVTSTITNISRDDARGDNSTNNGRNIFIRRYKGGPVIWSTSDVTTYTHTIGTNINLGTHTYTLEPGIDATGDSLYYRSNTVGHDNDSPPNMFIDEISMGIQFKNILPADYRPGAILDGNGVWQSHNRDNGESHILGPNSAWIEMRTIGGGVECGNPPSIRKNDKWYNMLEIGKE